MIKYARIENKETGLCSVGEGSDTSFYEAIGMTKLDVSKSDIDNAWYLTELCHMKTEEQKEKEEKDRIYKLKCTKRVFILMLEKMGLDYFEQIEPLINNNRQAKLEWELCVELERSNPLLDVLGNELGVTSSQLDKLFQYANGEDVELEVVNG